MEKLKAILEKNFAHLGFTMSNFKVSEESENALYRAQILCPCGGTEFFAFKKEHDLPISDEDLAYRILSRVASKSHLEEDVKNGTLPPFDLDKHVFKDLI